MVHQLSAYMQEYAQLPTYYQYLTEKFQTSNTPGKNKNSKNHPRMDSNLHITQKPTYQRNQLVMPFLPQVPWNTQPPHSMQSPQLTKIQLKLQIKLHSIFTKYLIDPHLY